jgi:hypothetical protein
VWLRHWVGGRTMFFGFVLVRSRRPHIVWLCSAFAIVKDMRPTDAKVQEDLSGSISPRNVRLSLES